MLLIGIAGANPLARDRVASAMVSAKVCKVALYSDAPLRSETAQARVDRLNEMIKATPAKGAECLLVPHVVRGEESRRIRELGGHVVHVEGVPSDEVPIVRGDLLVTATDGGHRHFIDSAAALSELWARKGVM